MIKRTLSIILLVTVAFNLTGLKAQNVLNGVYVQKHVPERKPIPYQYLREADVMWAKTVWRKIQLKEKMNFPLYYPEQPIGDRMSLMSLLMYGAKNEGLILYDEDDQTGDEFSGTLGVEDVQERLGASKETVSVTDVLTGEITEQEIENEGRPQEVKELLIKEVWFFDKQRSVMEVRIIGICPIRISRRGDDPEAPLEQRKVFWVYYPAVRKLLANHFAFNPKNDIQSRSFDDIFQSRMFSSYIVQESNAYNNRAINSYTIGLESMLEAERIKESIFNFEQDLWHY